MRVLLVANTLPPRDLSGVGEQVLQLASGLRAEGHEVEILGRGPGGAPGPKLLFPLTVTMAFLRRLRDFRPHVVQVHESDGAVVALLARTIAALCRPSPLLVALLQVSYVEEIKAVRTLRADGSVLSRPGPAEIRFRLFKAPLHVSLGCLTAWLADAVLAPSRVTADEIARDYGIGSVGIVSNVTGGLDWDATSAAPAEGGDTGLLFVGRLRIRKGVEVLMRAVKELRTTFPEVRLSVVGDGEQRRALEELLRDLDLGTEVRILGRRSPADVRRLLACSRALIVPSIYEGMPLVVLEAMDRSIPVVASAVSGIPEVVVDGETGWLVPPEDPSRLAAALGEVLADPGEARRRGAAGRLRVERHFRPAHAARQWQREVLPLLGDDIEGSAEK